MFFIIVLSQDSKPEEKANVTPPLIFPSENSGYQIVTNETIINILTQQTERNVTSTVTIPNESSTKEGDTNQTLPTTLQTDKHEYETVQPKISQTLSPLEESELKDMREGGIFSTIHNHHTERIIDQDLNEKDASPEETEWIESNGDEKDITYNVKNIIIQNNVKDEGTIRGQTAVILAGVFGIIAVTAYAALILWRRHME